MNQRAAEMPPQNRKQRWLARVGWGLLAYIAIVGFTAPFWLWFSPPRTVAQGLLFFTVMPAGGLLLYLIGETLWTPWRELGLPGKLVKSGVLLLVEAFVVLLAIVAGRG